MPSNSESKSGHKVEKTPEDPIKKDATPNWRPVELHPRQSDEGQPTIRLNQEQVQQAIKWKLYELWKIRMHL